ncbi:MAG: pyridoxal phosphate-dependent aminotransferase [bacterium]
MIQIPLSGIKKIEEVAGSSSEYISLSQGSIKVGGIPQQIKDHVSSLLKTDTTDYYQSCWGLYELREKLAQVLSAKYNNSISARQIIPSHGCIGGLSLLYLTLLEPGDETIILQPSYPAYTMLAQASRSVVVYVSCLKQTKNSNTIEWELDVERIKRATTSKTKMIIFSNPCNPIGMVVPQQTLVHLVEWCEKHGIYLVIDEAYRDYVFEGQFFSGLELINQSEWVISANTFSKNMSMSGWRIGYLVVAEKLMGALAGMQDTLLSCLNNTAQHAAIYALDHPEFTKTFFDKIRKNRDQAMSLIQPLVDNGLLSYGKPVGGFFLFLKTKHEDTTDLCMDMLYKAKVGVIPGKSFGSDGASFFRLCFARDPEVLQEGIRRILNYFL